MDYAEKILQSWEANAGTWINTIDRNEIESRTLITNKAIVDAILHFKPESVIDIGCGEGWLTRTLRGQGIEAFGIDAIPTLIGNAMAKDGDHYEVCTYEALLQSNGALLRGKDAAVFNFSLLDESNTKQLIHFLPQHLPAGAHTFIQTLHPLTVAGSGAYVTGWKEGSWNGLSQQFVLPYQWYFRTLETWIELFAGAGVSVSALREPLHPITKQPASVIFVLRCQ